MSTEGATQGDPLAMALFAIATIPLIDQLKQDILQVWYADDAPGLASYPLCKHGGRKSVS